jgi:outer membrane protein assembly factor BamB
VKSVAAVGNRHGRRDEKPGAHSADHSCYLFTLNINGVITAYYPQTGERAFRGRVGTGGSFAASPIGADGRLYIATEDGEVYVLTAGPELKQLAKNEMKEVIMATPAISDGLVVIRTLGHVFGIGQ